MLSQDTQPLVIEEKPAETGAKKLQMAPRGVKKHRKRSPYQSYGLYIHKVLRQVHPEARISSKAMAIMDSLVHDMFDRIATEAGRLARYNKRRTILSREIQTAVRLLLPGELANHAISEGTKAIAQFNSHFGTSSDKIAD